MLKTYDKQSFNTKDVMEKLVDVIYPMLKELSVCDFFTDIHQRFHQERPDDFPDSDSDDWLKSAIKELLEFLCTYLDDNLTFVTYFYKLAFFQVDLGIKNFEKTLTLLGKVAQYFSDPDAMQADEEEVDRLLGEMKTGGEGKPAGDQPKKGGAKASD